ncbi:hypothetical protein LPJ66_010394, partial [Kickxella alabastrina]
MPPKQKKQSLHSADSLEDDFAIDAEYVSDQAESQHEPQEDDDDDSPTSPTTASNKRKTTTTTTTTTTSNKKQNLTTPTAPKEKKPKPGKIANFTVPELPLDQ